MMQVYEVASDANIYKGNAHSLQDALNMVGANKYTKCNFTPNSDCNFLPPTDKGFALYENNILVGYTKEI